MNSPRPVTEPDRYGYQPVHDETQPCLGCGKTVTFSEDTGSWWIPYERGNPPVGTFDCPGGGGVAGRHAGSVPRFDRNAVLRDQQLRVIGELVGYMDLHVGKYQIKQLTTEQKELWADMVDATEWLQAREDPSSAYPDGIPRRTPRWWRDDYDGPTGPDDPRWHYTDRREPDPFRYIHRMTTTEDTP
ncbi:hypothetical protein [Nocardioides sp. InS609-2]|uniref:hypothetical protein n=1 Tax=Nocardioides sp. InS609-2 TaxID=2760705 RepID=UPI0020C05029|nr:hypothetical protein [Nocardioides sp. InS609-2]